MTRAAAVAFAAWLMAALGAPAIAAAPVPDYPDSRLYPAVTASLHAPSPSPTEPVAPVGVPEPTRTLAVASGVASWYCLPGRSACTAGYRAGGAYAAAGPALRAHAGWRGSYVVVRHGDVAVRVQLVDWCECPGGRLLDLYGSVFKRLAPLSVGLVQVEVTR